jgi:hypothetical protein
MFAKHIDNVTDDTHDSLIGQHRLMGCLNVPRTPADAVGSRTPGWSVAFNLGLGRGAGMPVADQKLPGSAVATGGSRHSIRQVEIDLPRR